LAQVRPAEDDVRAQNDCALLRSSLRTRERILDAALRVMHERDSINCSVDDIVQTSGFTKGALYYHFKTKSALILAVVDERLVPRAERLLDLRWLDLQVQLCRDLRPESSREYVACRLLYQAPIVGERDEVLQCRRAQWARCRARVAARLQATSYIEAVTAGQLAQLLMLLLVGQCFVRADPP
jgi:AcrR family transcriptional regulator